MENKMNRLDLPYKDASVVKCKCGSKDFTSTVRVLKFSALLTGYPHDSYMPLDFYWCKSCNEPFTDMIPSVIRNKFIDNIETKS